MKNKYFSDKAAAINAASEARDIEQQFRLAKNYSSLTKSKRLLIKPVTLKDHFKSHFSERAVSTQPELETPTQFPHILPLDNIIVNEGIPTEREIKSAINSLNNNKCQGTDGIYSEQLKYSNSKSLLSQLLLLLTTIWISLFNPDCLVEIHHFLSP